MRTKNFYLLTLLFFLILSASFSADSKISSIEKEVKDIVKNRAPSVAKIISEDGRRTISSGVVIDQGYILSHPLALYPEKQIYVENFKGERVKAEVIGVDWENSIALLKVDKKYFEVPIFGDSSKIEIGDWVIAIGCSIENFPSTSFGIVNSLRGKEFYVSLATPPGGSGSGVFNSKGELIGILRGAVSSWRFELLKRRDIAREIPSSRGGSFSLVIPIEKTKEIYQELKRKSIEKRPYLGVLLNEVDGRVIIQSISKDSPAEKADLRKNDYIISIDGKRVYSSEDVSDEISKIKAGEKIIVELERDGKIMKKEVILEEAPRGYFEQPRREPFFFTPPLPVTGAYLGVLIDSPPQNVKPQEGAYIKEVLKKSPAEKAGLREGDIIISIDKEKVFSPQDVIEIIRNKKPGDEVEITFIRKGKENKCTAIMEKRREWTWYWDWEDFSKYLESSKEEMQRILRSVRERLNSMKITIKSKKEGIEI